MGRIGKNVDNFAHRTSVGLFLCKVVNDNVAVRFRPASIRFPANAIRFPANASRFPANASQPPAGLPPVVRVAAAVGRVGPASAQQAGAVGGEELLQVFDACHQALALVGVAYKYLTFSVFYNLGVGNDIHAVVYGIRY